MKDLYSEEISVGLEKSVETFEWLKSFDIRCERTRFSRYLERIKEVQDNASNGNMKDLDRNSDIYFDAIYEFSDLSYAYEIFKETPPAGLESLLRKLVKGPDFTRDETDNSSSGRNFSFEVVIAARLAATGFDVTFTESGDVTANFQKTSVYLQCKRPSTVKAMTKRMKEASKQLQFDLENTDNDQAIGVIAVDATRMINPELRMFNAASRGKSDKLHLKILDEFCAICVEPVIEKENLRRHPSIFGVQVRFAGQWGIQDTATILYQHDILMNFLPELDSRNKELADSYLLATQQQI